MALTDDMWRVFPQMPLLTEVQPYMVETTEEGNIVYKCYTDNAMRIIIRTTIDGALTTTEKAFGAWANRATLLYVPINAKNPTA